VEEVVDGASHLGGRGEVLETTEARVEVDEDGSKSVNEYLIIKTIGKGSFAKVKVLHLPPC
jgi:hypothetical protein